MWRVLVFGLSVSLGARVEFRFGMSVAHLLGTLSCDFFDELFIPGRILLDV